MKKSIAVGVILLFLCLCFSTTHAIGMNRNNSIESSSLKPTNSYDAYGNHTQNLSRPVLKESNSCQTNFTNPYSYYSRKIFRTMESTQIIYVPDDYPTIQGAIDAALPNDTIIVRDGTYTQNLIVNKPLILQSEHGFTNCIIKEQDPSKDIIKITSDYVSIIGFKIWGSEEGSNAGISHYYVNHTSIIGNWIIAVFYCTKAEYSNNNIFHDNEMGSEWNIESWGIVLKDACNNSIYNNTIHYIEEDAVAIHLYHSFNNEVYHNTLTGSYDMGLLHSQQNRIHNNHMGWTLWEKMHIENSSYNYIENNTFDRGDYDGVCFHQSNYNFFSNNTCNSGISIDSDSFYNSFLNNTVYGKALVVLENVCDYTVTEDAGQIILRYCNNITISHQNISGINRDLVIFESNYCRISNSTFSSANYEGVDVSYSDHNVFRNLTLVNTWKWCGISLSHCNNTEIGFCFFYNNFYNLLIQNSPFCNIHNNSLPGRDNYGLRMVNSNSSTISSNNFSNILADSLPLN